MSPTMSPIYPDRPIRPLPKRSLRERMSSEAPDKTSSHPMAHYPRKSSTYVPYSKTIAERDGPMMRNVLSEINRAIPQAQKQMAEEEKAAYRFRGNEINSEEEGDDDDIGVNYRHQDSSRRGNGTIKGHHYDAEKSHSASSNDSADGYESFENTNNKKKRKIPTSGNLPASMSASLSQDLANMGISNDEESVDRADDGVSHYYSTGTGVNLNGNGISSAARGRYGKPSRRDTPGRVPLHSSMNAPNVWPNGKSSGSKSKSEMKGKFLFNKL